MTCINVYAHAFVRGPVVKGGGRRGTVDGSIPQ